MLRGKMAFMVAMEVVIEVAIEESVREKRKKKTKDKGQISDQKDQRIRQEREDIASSREVLTIGSWC